jgi:capsular exopolysaccharide family
MGKQQPKQASIIHDREQSAVAEAFRAIRASITAAEAEGELKTILFTSASSGESGAMAAVNTAAALAYAGKRVVLVDCDLRKPILDEVFSVPNIGIVNVIVEKKALEALLQPTGIAGLKVLTGGPAIRHPVELLSHAAMRNILAALKTMADYVVINSSPLIIQSGKVISDACILAAKVDGVILVVDKGRIQVKTAPKVADLLRGTKARIIGAVLSGVTDDGELVYNVAAK